MHDQVPTYSTTFSEADSDDVRNRERGKQSSVVAKFILLGLMIMVTTDSWTLSTSIIMSTNSNTEYDCVAA